MLCHPGSERHSGKSEFCSHDGFQSTQDAFRLRNDLIYRHISVGFALNYFKEYKTTVFRVWMEYLSCIAASLQLRSGALTDNGVHH